jgi:acetylornithine deacetylase
MALSDAERAVCTAIEQEQARLVALATDLIGFDTTARELEDPPREERAMQEYLAARLAATGAEIDLFEPDPAALAGRPLIPPGLDFAGRPQLISRREGRGGGRSLLLHGHIDAVSAEPHDAWTTAPFSAQVRDGNLYGRGACDMKGGLAAIVTAAEALAELGIELDGDLLVATNTDEESTGAGGTTLVDRGLKADAAIVAEPTDFEVWIACRGTDYARITVPGRPGHAEVNQPPWQEGGAVNAIERATVVLEAVRSLREDWHRRAGLEHPLLSRPSLLPTIAQAGEWRVTYPASCELTVAVMYLPAQADENGWSTDVRREVEEWIARAAAQDDWLAENPPQFDWWPNGVMPFELDPGEPIVATIVEASHDTGRPTRLSGLDSWYDGATLTHVGGIPAIAYGPPSRGPDGVGVAHTIDEYVPVDGLVSTAQTLAVAAMRFCAA